MENQFTPNEYALLKLALEQVAITGAERRHYVIGGKMLEKLETLSEGIDFKSIENHD